MVDIEQDPEAADRSSSRPTTATRPSRRWSTPTAPPRPTPPWPRSRTKLARRWPPDADPASGTCSGAGHQWPGSGPPYQCSTSDGEIETPPGSTSVAGLGAGLHLVAGEPAGVLDLVAVDVDLAWSARGRRSRASGWPGAARAGCRSSPRRRPRRRPPRPPRGVRRPRGSRPARRSRPASSSGPPATPAAARAGSARPRRPARPWVTTMITAGSVRGNCCLAARRCRRARGRPPRTSSARRSAGRTGWRRATRPARSRGRPAAPGRLPVGQVREHGRAGSPTRRARPRRLASGSTITANQVRPSRSPSSTRSPVRRVGRARPTSHRRRRPGGSGVPATTSTRVSGSAQRSVQPASSVRRSRRPVVGVGGEREVREGSRRRAARA